MAKKNTKKTPAKSSVKTPAKQDGKLQAKPQPTNDKKVDVNTKADNKKSDTKPAAKKGSSKTLMLLLILALLGGAGYYFKDQILQNELVKKYILGEEESNIADTEVSNGIEPTTLPKQPVKKVIKINEQPKDKLIVKSEEKPQINDTKELAKQEPNNQAVEKVTEVVEQQASEPEQAVIGVPDKELDKSDTINEQKQEAKVIEQPEQLVEKVEKPQAPLAKIEEAVSKKVINQNSTPNLAKAYLLTDQAYNSLGTDNFAAAINKLKQTCGDMCVGLDNISTDTSKQNIQKQIEQLAADAANPFKQSKQKRFWDKIENFPNDFVKIRTIEQAQKDNAHADKYAKASLALEQGNYKIAAQLIEESELAVQLNSLANTQNTLLQLKQDLQNKILGN